MGLSNDWNWLRSYYAYLLHHTTSDFTNRHVKQVLLSRSIQASDLLSIRTLPRSMTIGYIFPAILMSLPVFSWSAHPSFVASWHLFPVWAELMQLIFWTLYRFFQIVTMSPCRKLNVPAIAPQQNTGYSINATFSRSPRLQRHILLP